MRKSLGRIGFALLLLVLVAFIALATWEPFWAKRGDVALPDRTYTAEISRDEFGVPHIYAATDADVAYGVAVAHSEDDFSTLQDVIAMSRGRYGAIAGEEGAAFDYAYTCSTRAARPSANIRCFPQTCARCSMPMPSASTISPKRIPAK